MSVRMSATGGSIAVFCLLVIASIEPARPITVGARAGAQQVADQDRVADNQHTLLSRIKRDKAAYRGDSPGQMRIKWEWVDLTLTDYVFEKNAFLREASAGEKYELRPRWVFKNMKVTYQDIFGLGPEDDDKLFPLSPYTDLLRLAPNSTFAGLTLLGKQGEVKGKFQKKVGIEEYARNFEGTLLEYTDKNGKSELSLGIAPDAYTLRWKDIKNRVADDMSEEKAVEDLEIERDKRFVGTAPPTRTRQGSAHLSPSQ